MLIRNLFLIAVPLIGLGALAWRLGVGQSRLALRSDAVHFPTVSGFNLQRQELVFPRDFAGERNIVFVPFQQWQQSIVDSWVPLAQELEAAHPGVAYYELPTINEMPMVARTFINEGMRAGIPDETSRERTVTLYVDLARFMRALDIANRDEVHTLLVDREGRILWRTVGPFDEAAGEALRVAIAGGK